LAVQRMHRIVEPCLEGARLMNVTTFNWATWNKQLE
jgi:hypothetical protein